MSHWLLKFALCAVALALPVTAARFPFDPSRGLVELEGSVNGFFTGRFGIDTGAEGFYLDEQFARAAGLELSEPEPGRVVRGLDGSSEIRRATLRSFAVGDERLYNLGVDVVDLGALSHSAAAPPDGLVGQDVLRRFYLTIDYPQRRLDLFSHEPDHSSESLRVVAFDKSQPLIYLDVSL
ncbi:MAG TPA: retropepsin-like aspartic protease, partial [candidate division Zixibacteria bacterium]|nr:retropepsin-like aspartic protease [candidate division Zixibacteria bacterium]